MSIFNFIGGQVALSSSAVQSTDNFANGVRFNTSGSALASTSAPTTLSNGLPFASTGVVSYVDATAGLPAGTTWTNGLPFSSSGALCVSTTAPTVWSNGVPFDLNGAVSALVNSLELNFLQGSLDSRITFARADATTCATFFNDSGLLQTAAANVPRFDFDPVTRTPRGLLIEESRQNLLLQSRDMTQAAWTKTDVTPARTQVGLDGVANTACLMTEGSAGTAGVFQSGAAVTAGSTLTASVVVKRGNNDFFYMFAQETTGVDGAACTFNINTGAIGTPTAFGAATSPTATITNLGGGWYRCTVSCVPNGTYTVPRITFRSCTSLVSTTRVSGATYIVDCAQLEVGAFATSIIPCGATALTRAADSASMTGTNFSSWFSATEGTFVAEYMPGSADGFVFDANDGTANNRTRVFRASVAGTAFAVDSAGASQANITTSVAPRLESAKIAGAYAANDFAACQNGGTVSTDVSGSVAVSPNRLDLGARQGATSYLCGWIRSLRFYPKRLGNSQIQALTS